MRIVKNTDSMRALKKYLAYLYGYLAKQTAEAGQQINLFAIVMMINFPLFGVVWKIESIFANEEYFLRVVATCLCLFLFSYRFWPARYIPFLPILWYLTLLFCLPFFFSYLTLLHHGSTIWLMNCVSAIFFLFLITRAIDALVLLFLGFSLAFFTYIYSDKYLITYIPGDISLFSLITTFMAAIIIGALFARDRENMHANKISGMRLLAGSLAHDLRTSLASIHLQAELQETIIKKLNNPDLQMDLKKSLNKIIRGIEMGNQLISMQLNNIQHEKFDTKKFTIQPIDVLLRKTLNEYPLKAEQISLIQADLSNNFLIWIEEVAFKNLIWNLLKNSLDYIEEVGKGDISIWLEEGPEGDDFNYLNVRDTAKGIYPRHAEKIFQSFYSDRQGGTGVGLAYCKLLMKAAGGDIYCQGSLNQYAHFILKFPKID
ncbi:sensor histidine kinase/response regulator LuxN [Legionella londiniensis]|uniref:histidine kinase n=2 Tax=Legionella londiniensis TaxID=45068 RepID=A0A0W0VNP9_9GAMM|nr:sensor histidine kinase/response regulator LuxN [Legionella londiniensis]